MRGTLATMGKVSRAAARGLSHNPLDNEKYCLLFYGYGSFKPLSSRKRAYLWHQCGDIYLISPDMRYNFELYLIFETL